MKKKTVKCFKCGTVYELDIKHISNLVSCPHCHKKMELDKKNQKRLRIVRYFLLLILAFVFMYLTQYLTKDTDDMFLRMLPLIIYVVAIMFFAQEADTLCIKILHLLFKDVTYVEYIPKVKVEQKKTEKKKKKGLFSWISKKD